MVVEGNEISKPMAFGGIGLSITSAGWADGVNSDTFFVVMLVNVAFKKPFARQGTARKRRRPKTPPDNHRPGQSGHRTASRSYFMASKPANPKPSNGGLCLFPEGPGTVKLKALGRGEQIPRPR